MQRRTFLKSIGAVPLALAINSIPVLSEGAVTPALTTLDVMFHGLFGFGYNSSSQKIEIHIPEVNIPGHQHVYRAGSWITPMCEDDSSHEPDMSKGEEYRLQLTNFTPIKAGFPDPVPDSEVRLSKPITMDYSKRYCYLELPATPYFRPAHRASRIDSFPFFVGDDVKRDAIRPTKIARTYIFTYNSSTPFQAQLLRKNNTQFWIPLSAGDQLHCFAQPLSSVAAGNEPMVLDAFEKLRSMCGHPSIFPVPFHVGDFQDIDSFVDQESSLGERDCYLKTRRGTTPPAAIGGGEVANCLGLIFPRP
jgi:hypothetical protein